VIRHGDTVAVAGAPVQTLRCTRCGSRCQSADDCDLLLTDRLLDHTEG
jgi:hypothetical protein